MTRAIRSIGAALMLAFLIAAPTLSATTATRTQFTTSVGPDIAGGCVTEWIDFEGTRVAITGSRQSVQNITLIGIGRTTGDRYVFSHQMTIVTVPTAGAGFTYTEEFHGILNHAGSSGATEDDGFRGRLTLHVTTTPDGSEVVFVDRPTFECF